MAVWNAGPTTLPADVAIVIALTEEWEVFWPIAGEPGGVKDDSGGYLYYFDVPGLGRPYRCVALFMGAMGPGQATHATTRLLATKPRTVVNLGIAAAIHDDLKLCDVVVAEQVDDFLSTVKAVPKGKDGWTFEARGSVYRTTHALVQDLVNLKFAHRDAFTRWRSMCAPAMAEHTSQIGTALAAKHIRDAPEIMNVHLASGPVLAAAESFSKWIRTRDGLLKALEMEAAGVMLAVHQQTDLARTLVLRGISDFGDERKSQTDRDSGGAFRRLAMFNATQLLWAMMQQGLLPRHEPTSGGPHPSSSSDAAPHARAVEAQPDSEGGSRESDSVQADDDGAATARQAAEVAAANAEFDRMLERDDPGVWGLQAAHRERQALVDAALDRCTDASFCALVRVIAQPRRTSLGLVGAHEALFAAAARRLSRGDFAVPSADFDAWHQLAELQIGSLVTSGIARHPYTREGEHFEAWDTFWADGWTFSLRIPSPPNFDHPDLVWYFPGWAKQLDASPMPKHWPSSSVSPFQASAGVRRMSGMAFEVLPRLTKQPFDVDFPRVLLPALISLAPSRGWQLTAKLLSALSGSWEERAFVRMVIQRPPEERTRLADLLWDVLPYTFNPGPEMPVTQRLRRLESSSRRLLPFIMANLSEAALSRTIVSDGVGVDDYSVASLRLLPRPLRHLCARAVLTVAQGQLSDWDQARTIARILDSVEDIEFILALIRESNANVAAEFTKFIWRVAPVRALNEAEEAFVHGRSSAHGWFFFAPQTDLPRLLQVVEESPEPLPQWMQEWAKKRALDGGSCSERLFSLAHATPTDDSETQHTQTVESTATPEEPVGAEPLKGTNVPSGVVAAPSGVLPHSATQRAYGEIEIALERLPGGYRVVLRIMDPGSDAELAPIQGPAAIDLEALLAAQADTTAYGRLLTGQVFSDQNVRERYLTAQAAFERGGLGIRIRVSIDRTAEDLHELRWELLRDPKTDAPLATSELILLSRFMASHDSRQVLLRPRTQLRAVIAVSAPSNLAKYDLDNVDLPGEVECAQQALVNISVTIVGKDQPLTLEHLKAALREGADIVYLVCHGGFTRGIEPFLYLQDTAGLVAPVKAAEFAQQIRELAQAPRLMVLASCESASREGATALPAERTTAQTSLAPLLANAGVSVVLAMQGKISMRTVKAAMPLFFKELMKDGQIDRALAVARGAVRGHPDYWMPALFLRLKGGRMWSDLTPVEPRPSNQVPRETDAVDPQVLQDREVDLCWTDAERLQIEKILTTVLRDAPALSRSLETRLALRMATPVGSLPDDIHVRVAQRIVSLGRGCPAAVALAEDCCKAVIGEMADARGEQREARKLLEQWLPRGYGDEARVVMLTLSGSPSQEGAPAYARHIEVGTLSPFIAEVRVAASNGRPAAFATRNALVDGQRLRQVEGRARFPTRSASSEILTGDGIARAIVRSAYKRYMLESTTSDAMAMLNAVTELETQMELTGLRHYVVFTWKERCDELFAAVIQRLGELFPQIQVAVLGEEPGSTAPIPDHIRQEAKLLTYLRRIFEDHGSDDVDT